MNDVLFTLATEANNCTTTNIDGMSSAEIVECFNREDEIAVKAVKAEKESIAQAIDEITKSFMNQGRLFYFGCGTSGRLGILDASECPPTFGTDPEMVQGIIAGGDVALRHAVEDAEDDYQAGCDEVNAQHITNNDIVVGITASGRSPYVLGAVKKARELGAITIGLCNNKNSELSKVCDITIAPEVGPEVIQGSTRLKAGTSQKLVLNMLTSGAMIKIGKVYGNLMVDMRPSNKKLFNRAIHLVCQSTGVSEEKSKLLLTRSNYHVKSAIVMALTDKSFDDAKELLDRNNGFIRKAIEEFKR